MFQLPWRSVVLGVSILAFAHSNAWGQDPRGPGNGDPLPPHALARLGRTRFLHDTIVVRQITFSSDGKRVISEDGGFTLYIWDAETGRELLKLPETGATALSQDGARLAAGKLGEAGLRIFDLASGKPALEFVGPAGPVRSLAFRSEGNSLVTVDAEGAIQTWDARTGKELRKIAAGGIKRLGQTGFTEDGRRAFVVNDDGTPTVAIWDIVEGRELRRIEAYYPQWLSGGTKLAVRGFGGTFEIWDVLSGEKSLTVKAALRAPASFSRDGRLMAWADQGVEVREVDSGKLRLRIPEAERTASTTWSPDSSLLITSGNGGVHAWDSATGRERFRIQISGEGPEVALSPDGRKILTGASMTIRVWDAAGGQEILTGPGHVEPVQAIDFSPDGRQLLSGGSDGVLFVWEVSSGKEVSRTQRRFPNISIVSSSPDGKTLLSGNREEVVLSDRASGKPLWTVKPEGESWFHSAVHSRDGKQVVMCERDAARLVDVATGKDQRRLTVPNGFLSADLSPDGSTLASTGMDGLRLWDTRTGKTLSHVPHVPGKSRGAICVSVFADGKLLATGEKDGFVRLWTVDGLREILAFQSREPAVTCLAVAPDGKTIACSGGEPLAMVFGVKDPGGEPVIRVFDASTGRETLALRGHTRHVTDLTFSPGGRILASAGTDSTILLWDLTAAK